jgi:hypothetical protein
VRAKQDHHDRSARHPDAGRTKKLEKHLKQMERDHPLLRRGECVGVQPQAADFVDDQQRQEKDQRFERVAQQAGGGRILRRVVGCPHP